MSRLAEIQVRFLKEENSMKLGHLASDLARIASLTEMKAGRTALKSVLEEAKYFSEWAATATNVPLETQMFLAEIQSFIAQKELEFDSMFENQEWRAGLRSRARVWSQELLKRAGFFDSNEQG